MTFHSIIILISVNIYIELKQQVLEESEVLLGQNKRWAALPINCTVAISQLIVDCLACSSQLKNDLNLNNFYWRITFNKVDGKIIKKPVL